MFYAKMNKSIFNHALGIYKSPLDNKIYLYDPNSSDNPYVFDQTNIEDLVKQLLICLKMENQFENLHIKVFSLPEAPSMPVPPAAT